ncbi:protein phosphatase CheZ [Kordiimonas pumila]|uniref:Protein phosphatase CheZ n=1 Tax=Kordiimonas pumila TaxID=2161677 RepID=A0ABV7D331_9PROT|nr:protein phosphatase CheZ [Kordiimonas pumila]
MASQAKVITLEDRVKTLRDTSGDSVSVDDIAGVVGALVEGTTHDDGLDKIAVELRELLQFIGAAKEELVGMQAKSLSNRDIPDAGIQLDAVVSATEVAASSIMDAADQIGAIAEDVDDDTAVKLNDIATNLFQASSFQDITGQRITKVTRTLEHLEERLNALADAIGDDYVAPDEAELEIDEDGIAVDADDLLHGPQLEGEGNSQDEIDAILASFD